MGVVSDVAVEFGGFKIKAVWSPPCLFTSVSSLGAGLPSSLHMYGTETKKNSFTFASAGVWKRLLKEIVWSLEARKNLNSTKTVELSKTRVDPCACATFLPVSPGPRCLLLEADVLLFNQNGLHNAVCSWKHQVVACAHGIYIFVCLVLYIYGFEHKNQKNTRQIVEHLLKRHVSLLTTGPRGVATVIFFFFFFFLGIIILLVILIIQLLLSTMCVLPIPCHRPSGLLSKGGHRLFNF